MSCVFGRPLQVTMLRDRSSSLPCLSVTFVYCSQTVGWIKIPLGTEVGLGPGDTVLHGDPAPTPHRKAHSSPLLWPNGRPSQQLLISCSAYVWPRIICRPTCTENGQLWFGSCKAHDDFAAIAGWIKRTTSQEIIDRVVPSTRNPHSVTLGTIVCREA